MGRLVEFDLADGGSVLVELTPAAASERVPAPRVPAGAEGGPELAPVTRSIGRGATMERAQRTFEEAVDGILPAVQNMIGRMRELAETPDEVCIEFGLDLHAEAGAFIASASTGANFSVSLTWCRERRDR